MTAEQINADPVFVEQVTKFFEAVVECGVVSHVGVVGYDDDSGYRRADIYTLTTFPLDQWHMHRKRYGEKLIPLRDAGIEFAYSSRPGIFINHWLVDCAQYEPEQLEKALQEGCKGSDRLLLGFDPVRDLLNS